MIDSHTHLYWERFDDDRQAVIERARAVGIEAMIVIGCDLKTSRAAEALADTAADLHCSAGFHPNDLETVTEEDWDQLEAMIASGKFVAVGETGLDYYWKKPVAPQFEALNRQFQLAETYDLPLIIHTRDSIDDLLSEIEMFRKPLRGVLHCFSGDADQMQRGIDLGFDVSFAGPLTYKKSEAIREACINAPLNRIHIETDCPFLPPQSQRGQRNEPAWVAEVLAKVAELKDLSLAEADSLTTANSRRLFAI